MSLVFENVSHSYGAQQVLRDVSLEARSGELLCLLGPSGSGKSTLLRVAAGLEPLQQGTLRLGDRTLADLSNNPPPEKRPMGLLFQDHVLFPHMTVGENVAFGLRDRSQQERDSIVARQLTAVRLGELADRYPHTLSGGQQQRVALARALARNPEVMLLDEPFTSVDATFRRELREDARAALRESKSIAIVVTHDPDEAMELADRIAVLVDGRIVQCGTPAEIWKNPADQTVAGLFGGAQTLSASVEDGQAVTAFGRFATREPNGAKVDVLIKPGAATLSHPGNQCTVVDTRFLGETQLLIVEANGHRLRIIGTVADRINPGDRVDLRFTHDEIIIYNCE